MRHRAPSLRDPGRFALLAVLAVSALLLVPVPPLLGAPITLLLVVASAMALQRVGARLAGHSHLWTAGAPAALAVAALLAVTPAFYGGVAPLERPITVALLDAVIIAGMFAPPHRSERSALGPVLTTVAICVLVLVIPEAADRFVGLQTPSSPFSSLSFVGGPERGAAPSADAAGSTVVTVRYQSAPDQAPLAPTATFDDKRLVPSSSAVEGNGQLLRYKVEVPAGHCLLPFTVRVGPSTVDGPDPGRASLRATVWLGSGSDLCSPTRTGR